MKIFNKMEKYALELLFLCVMTFMILMSGGRYLQLIGMITIVVLTSWWVRRKRKNYHL